MPTSNRISYYDLAKPRNESRLGRTAFVDVHLIPGFTHLLWRLADDGFQAALMAYPPVHCWILVPNLLEWQCTAGDHSYWGSGWALEVVVAVVLGSLRCHILLGKLPYLASYKLETLRRGTHNCRFCWCNFWLRVYRKCFLLVVLLDISVSSKYLNACE